MAKSNSFVTENKCCLLRKTRVTIFLPFDDCQGIDKDGKVSWVFMRPGLTVEISDIRVLLFGDRRYEEFYGHRLTYEEPL